MMPKDCAHDIPREIEDQLALYFDNQATDEVCRAIHDWLEEDPDNAAIFAEYASIERMIYCAQKHEDASAVFTLLQEAEDNAEADFSLLTASFSDMSAIDAGERSVTLHDLWSVAGYLTAKGLRQHAVAIGTYDPLGTSSRKAVPAPSFA